MKKDKGKTYAIGQVVDRLKGDFPAISISKIRFLEDAGLLAVERSKGGYRLFSSEDVMRLEEILKLQRDYYLPLQVIKDKMLGWDATNAASKFRQEQEAMEVEAGDEFKPLKLEEALAKTGLTAEEAKSIESFALIKPRQSPEGKVVGEEDFQIMKIYRELSKYGIEARHLRIYENFTNKETILFQQILAPQQRSRVKDTRQRNKSELLQLTELADRLHVLLRQKIFKQSELA